MGSVVTCCGQGSTTPCCRGQRPPNFAAVFGSKCKVLDSMYFTLATGRRITLNAFHLAPKNYFSAGSEAARDFALRLFPTATPVVVGLKEGQTPTIYTCVGQFHSNSPANDENAFASHLTVCWFVTNPDKPIRTLISEGLSLVDWEALATDTYWE